MDCGRICGQSKSSIAGAIKIGRHRYRRQDDEDILPEDEEEGNEEKNKCFENIICSKIPKECFGQMW